MSNILVMEQYISKSAVNAEIKRLLKSAEAYLKYHHDINNKSVYAFRQQQLVMCELLTFISSLEVKEVDLDNFIKEEFNKYSCVDGYGQLSVSYNEAEFYSMIKRLTKAQKGEEV